MYIIKHVGLIHCIWNSPMESDSPAIAFGKKFSSDHIVTWQVMLQEKDFVNYALTREGRIHMKSLNMFFSSSAPAPSHPPLPFLSWMLNFNTHSSNDSLMHLG